MAQKTVEDLSVTLTKKELEELLSDAWDSGWSMSSYNKPDSHRESSVESLISRYFEE